MTDFIAYLKDEMGLLVRTSPWREAKDLPIYLAKGASYHLCTCNGIEFIAASVEQESSLLDLKRLVSQVSTKANLSVVLVAQIDARQRKALVTQGIPFIVPGRQAFLPMLGFVAKTTRKLLPLAKTLAPSAQAALVALAANPIVQTVEELMKITNMPASSISRALDDLERRGLISKFKNGRKVMINRAGDRNSLIRSSIECLRNPITRAIYAKRNGLTDSIPLAGESALSRRSMLTAPRIQQFAVARNALKNLVFEEVQLGELPDGETIQIQIWSYNPLVAGGKTVDDVSLALTLINEGNERVIGELNTLFGEELWG